MDEAGVMGRDAVLGGARERYDEGERLGRDMIMSRNNHHKVRPRDLVRGSSGESMQW